MIIDDFRGLLGPNFKVEWLHWSPFRPLDIIICTPHSLIVEWSILGDFGDQFPPFFWQRHDVEQYGLRQAQRKDINTEYWVH